MPSINELSPELYWYFLFFTALIGLCVGSFLNVVILRGLSGESIVFPPSKCPKCKNNLKWYHNIPVFSYVFLRGKCHFCKEHISLQYPIVELLTSCLFVLLLIKFDFTLTTLFMWLMIPLFVAMSVTDIKEQVILTNHSYILAGLGVFYNILVNKDFLTPLLGIVAGALIMEILACIGLLCFKKRAFGEGDSYIGAAIGAIVGWKIFLYSLAIAIIFQTILILPSFLYKIFATKNYKLFVNLLLFTSLAIYLYITPAYNLNFIVHIALLVLLALFGFMAIPKIFDFVKSETVETIPFGPAMLIGAFVCIYFDTFISKFIF